MFNETIVTLRGYVGGTVTARTAGEVPVASFRLGCTPRYLQRKSQEWVDGETQWFTVTAWRALAVNCERSLRRGDAVVVHGKLTQRTYLNKAGVETPSLEVDAMLVGHDLSRGISLFTKTPRPSVPRPEERPTDQEQPANAEDTAAA